MNSIGKKWGPMLIPFRARDGANTFVSLLVIKMRVLGRFRAHYGGAHLHI